MPTTRQQTLAHLAALTPEQREIFRADIEEIIRNTYNAAWAESKRWPNCNQPPEIDVLWDQPNGLAIQEIW